MKRYGQEPIFNPAAKGAEGLTSISTIQFLRVHRPIGTARLPMGILKRVMDTNTEVGGMFKSHGKTIIVSVAIT